MLANGCKPPNVTNHWRDEARRLLDRDGRELDKALALIEWSQRSSFWATNIHSIPTFRRQYDKLRLAALAEWERERQPAKSGFTTPPSNAPVAIPPAERCTTHPAFRATTCRPCKSERLSKGAS